MTKFSTKLAGVTYDGRQSNIAFAHEGDPVELRREPGNRFDANAIRVLRTDGLPDARELGHIPRALARRLAPRLDAGDKVTARIVRLRGGSSRYPTIGVEIAIRVTK